MDTATSTIIGIIIGALSTYIVYLLQSRRDARILWKNRNHFLYKLINESTRLANGEVDHLKNWISSVRTNPHIFPLIPQASASKISFDALTDKVMLDEYYFAYSRLYANLIGAEKLFSDLQFNALHIKSIYDEAIRMISDGQVRNHAREKEALNLYKEATEWVNAQLPSSTGNERLFLRAFWGIHQTFRAGIGTTYHADLTGIFNHYFLPIERTIGRLGVLPNGLIPYGALANKFGDLYSEIPYQNNSLADDMFELLRELNRATSELINVKRYWDIELRKYLIDY